MTLRAHADRIAAEVGMDPVTILTFVSAVLPILMACMEPDEAEDHFRKDTPATRRQIRRACNRQWRRLHGTHAPKVLVMAVRDRLATMPPGGMRRLYEEG